MAVGTLGQIALHHVPAGRDAVRQRALALVAVQFSFGDHVIAEGAR